MPEPPHPMMLMMMFMLVSMTLVSGNLALELAGTSMDFGTSLGLGNLEAEFTHAAHLGGLELAHGFQSGGTGGLHFGENDGANAAEDSGAGVFARGEWDGAGLDF